MKKALKSTIIGLACLLLILFSSCNNPVVSNGSEDLAPYISYDFNQFLNDYTEAQQAESLDTKGQFLQNTFTSEVALVVPNLLSSEYSLSQIVVSLHTYEYYYPLNDFVENLHTFDYETGIIVTVYKNKEMFAGVAGRLESETENGSAYDAQQNVWYILQDGYCVEINLPPTLLLKSQEEVGQYFSFELYIPT